MAKLILVFVIGGLLGAAAGFALGIFVYPYICRSFQVRQHCDLVRAVRRAHLTRRNETGMTACHGFSSFKEAMP